MTIDISLANSFSNLERVMTDRTQIPQSLNFSLLSEEQH